MAYQSPLQNEEIAGRKVLILGLARQGLALARFFVAEGATVTISDAASEEALADEIATLGDLPVKLALGGHPLALLDGCDLLCLSGGVPPQLGFVREAVARGIPLTNDSLLTMQRARQRGLGPIIAITGSSGKTTTTTLVGKMLSESNLIRKKRNNRKVYVGGNIGMPLIDVLDTIRPEVPIVLELSSFQLELWDERICWGVIDGYGPDVAAVLNITPNHLDRHGTMRTYADAKFNLLRSLPHEATVVLSADDAVTALVELDRQREWHNSAPLPPEEWQLDQLLAELNISNVAKRHVQTVYFSRHQPLRRGAWFNGEQLYHQQQPVIRQRLLKLRGVHNISNLLAAIAISGSLGVKAKDMKKVARKFAGVAHRLEVVATADDITWINDSIATSPERAIAGLRCFEKNEQTLVLLAGGKDKNLPWEEMADEILARVDFLIGFGDAGPMIVNMVQERAETRDGSAPNCAVVQRLDEGVELAARAATDNTVVLLSPGGTSYDAYRNFEERGEHFRTLVNEQIAKSALKVTREREAVVVAG